MGEAKPEEAQSEVKKEEKVEEKKEDPPAEGKKEEAPPPPPIILFVDLHCVGCKKRVERCMMKYKGVECVHIDMSNDQVTVKGTVDPEALCLKIEKKTKRKAKVLSPLPAAPPEGDQEPPKPQVDTSQVSEVTTIELNVNMHCEACAQQLKSKILKMKGVQYVETELNARKVKVTGTMDANQLVNYVYRRTRKLAKILPQPEEKKEEGGKEAQKPPEEAPKEEEKKEENAETKEGSPEKDQGGEKAAGDKNEEKPSDGGGGGEDQVKKEGEEAHLYMSMEEMAKRMWYLQPTVYMVERVPPPQLFSDENPNACSIC